MKTFRELRDEQGWTQMEVAHKLGTSLATVYNWEGGKFEPRASQLRRIARLFGVSMDDIVLPGDTETVTRTNPSDGEIA